MEEIITAKDLCLWYSSTQALKNVSIPIYENSITAFIGPSGCGKSTLLRCINALEPIQGGEILLNGEPDQRDAKNISQMRQKIGMVFQSYELFPHKTIG